MILVIGGGGFIGSNMVEGLAASGDHRIVVCERFGPDEKWRNLIGVPVWELIAPQALPAWLGENHQELEAIFHLGGISSTTEDDAGLQLEQNYRLPLMLWRFCSDRGIRFFYLSSYATYGAGEHGFDDDLSLPSMLRLRPLSPHGWSKHLFDLHVAQCVAAGDAAPPQWAGLKLFNAYGPHEEHKHVQRSVIGQMIEQAVHTGSVRLFRSQHPNYADGEQLRDVIYVKDCVAVMLWLLEHENVSGLFNLGTGNACTFLAMAHAVFAALGREPRVHFVDMPETIAPNYQYFTEARMGRLRDAGYIAPFTPLKEGVKEYLGYYLAR
ncbi:MAG: ADP-glyceromanno-heptose 6-epimerase [Alphaproteobacteria bacterium]|nr:ADP-glyceromanno-heptose 6-epimerase [Alphaproteobacteria bacterium]